ncbi:unnamed protein product, partial [marine sediment metagenome]
ESIGGEMIDIKHRCKECSGSGISNDIECLKCDGTGFSGISEIN